jgi:CSLREA domain-containing protein
MTRRNVSKSTLAVVLSSLFAVTVSKAHADVVFNVDTLADQVDDDTGDGQCHTSANRCSLRAAIMQANHLGGPGLTIILLPAGTYVLTRAPGGANGEDTGDLNLVTPAVGGQTVSLIGAGAASTIIDANHLDRVLAVDHGCTARIFGVTIRNGTRIGFNLPLTRAVSDAVDVPVIASGGVGTLEHLVEGIQQGGADAVLAASIFHYGQHTVGEAKALMAARGIPVRL